MQRTNKIELTPNKKQKIILKEMMLLSSCVYNMANYEMRQSFFKREKTIGFHEMQQRLQKKEDYQLLGRSYALPRLQIYAETQSARFKLIKSKKQKKVGLPKYLKNRKTNTTIPSFLFMDNSQYHLGKWKATIPLSRQMREKYNTKHFDIKYNGILRWKGKQQRGQIRCENKKYYLYQSVKMPNPLPITSNVMAGIDLGIKNLITLVTTTGKELKIGSKRFIKQWNHHSKIISDEKSYLSTINKKSSNKLKRMYHKWRVYQQHLFNNIIKKTFRFTKRNNISTIILGDVKGIRDDNNKGRTLNRMLHNYWAFDQLKKKIINKTEEQGIKLHLTSEEYTSQTCPICMERTKPKDRIFICNFCGFIEHRDIIGASNILIKGMHDLQILAKCASGRDLPIWSIT